VIIETEEVDDVFGPGAGCQYRRLEVPGLTPRGWGVGGGGGGWGGGGRCGGWGVWRGCGGVFSGWGGFCVGV